MGSAFSSPDADLPIYYTHESRLCQVENEATPPRRTARNRADADHGFVLAILGMEMRWPVIGKIHSDDNTVKAANFRHGWARA